MEDEMAKQDEKKDSKPMTKHEEDEAKELARRKTSPAPDVHTSIPPEPGSMVVAAWQIDMP